MNSFFRKCQILALWKHIQYLLSSILWIKRSPTQHLLFAMMFMLPLCLFKADNNKIKIIKSKILWNNWNYINYKATVSLDEKNSIPLICSLPFSDFFSSFTIYFLKWGNRNLDCVGTSYICGNDIAILFWVWCLMLSDWFDIFTEQSTMTLRTFVGWFSLKVYHFPFTLNCICHLLAWKRFVQEL